MKLFKWLFKFILKLLLVVIILVVIVVGALLYAFSDSSDEAPLNSYSTETTVDSVLSTELNDALNNFAENYSIDLSLDETTLNQLVYGIIRKNVNTNYNPTSGTTDEEKYLYSNVEIPASTPVVGGKKLIVKHAYIDFSDDELQLIVTASGFGLLNTKLTIGLKIKTNTDDYTFEISTLKLGKLNLRSGLGKKVYDLLISNNVISESSLNETLDNKDLPLTLDLDTLTLASTKQELGDYIKQYVTSDDEDASSTDQVVQDFVDILVDPDNNMLNLNTVNEAIELKLDLAKLKVDEELTEVDESIKQQFDTDLFIKNKVQTFAITCLTATDKYMTFSEEEFARLIYSQTNGYEDLGTTAELIDNVSMTFKIEGILVDITATKFTLKLILNINGAKTLGIIDGTIEQITDTEVHINLNNNIVLGDGLEIGSGFLDSILAETLADNEIIQYNTTLRALVITSNVFDKFISETSTTTPLSVSKVAFIENALAIYVTFTDPTIDLLLTTVSTKIETILATDFVDTTKFDTTDPGQEEAITNITTTLEDIKDSLTDTTPSLDEEQTSALVENINNLSPENQEEFINQLQGEFSTSDLEDLYSQLFGTGE